MDDPLYIGIRFALYVDLMLLFGLPLFVLYTPIGRESVMLRRPIFIGLAVLGLALSSLAIAAMTSSMAGVSILDVDRGSIATMISDTPMGAAWSVRMATLALIAISLVVTGHPVVPTLLGAIALGSLAWTGHGAAGEGDSGTIRLLGDLVHLLAAAAWLGALVGLGMMALVNRDRLATHQALDRFALTGTVIVAAVVGSGLVNGFYLIGWTNLGNLPATLYGRLFLGKLALFGAMLVIAAINRFWLTPDFGRATIDEPDMPLQRLRLSLVVECSAAIAILGLIAWLGTLEPPMSF